MEAGSPKRVRMAICCARTASMPGSTRCNSPMTARPRSAAACASSEVEDAMRRLLRSAPIHRLLCWLIHLYIRFVHWTGRWTIEGEAIPHNLREAGRPFILAFWHGRLLMIPMAWQNLAPMHMLISGHRDGRIIADAVRHFGIDSIAGSSNQGGTGALRAMIRYVKQGDCVGITPDGPNGPAMRATTGIVIAAKISRAPIIPITYATRWRCVLGTWDRFHLP